MFCSVPVYSWPGTPVVTVNTIGIFAVGAFEPCTVTITLYTPVGVMVGVLEGPAQPLSASEPPASTPNSATAAVSRLQVAQLAAERDQAEQADDQHRPANACSHPVSAESGTSVNSVICVDCTGGHALTVGAKVRLVGLKVQSECAGMPLQAERCGPGQRCSKAQGTASSGRSSPAPCPWLEGRKLGHGRRPASGSKMNDGACGADCQRKDRGRSGCRGIVGVAAIRPR